MNEHKRKLKAFLDGIYYAYNRRELVHPDPLEFLYKYEEIADREIVGLIASSLAYGRVEQILKSVTRVLEALGPHPAEFLREHFNNRANICDNALASLSGFKHRFTTSGDVKALLASIARALHEHRSLCALMCDCRRRTGDYLAALDLFADALYSRNDHNKNKSELTRSNFPLVTRPGDGSACKRLMLFLRWMVRQDEVDPGCWCDMLPVTPGDLIIPTDTHVHAISRKLGLTCRKSADLTTALEITRALSELSPDDPTRYDFSLTRFGIRDHMSIIYFNDFNDCAESQD